MFGPLVARRFSTSSSLWSKPSKSWPAGIPGKFYDHPRDSAEKHPGGGHPKESFWLRYTDWQPIQQHSRDVKIQAHIQPPEIEYKPPPPRPDKLYKTIELEVLGYENQTLDSYEWFVLSAATHLGIKVGKRWTPDILTGGSKYRFNLLRSVHVHKRAQVHYEVRTYHRIINLHKLTGSTADTFLEYIERNLPEGVGLKVSKFEVMKVPDYINNSQVNDSDSDRAVSSSSSSSSKSE